MKRTITSVILIAVLAAFVLCGDFVSPIFIDMLILLFMAGATLEMRRCLKDAGYEMYIAPAAFVLVAAYPTFYLLQHFVGGSMGIQGLLFILLLGVMLCLGIFTFKPSYIAHKRISELSTTEKKVDGDSEQSENVIMSESEATAEVVAINDCAANTQNDGKSRVGELLANVFVLIYPLMFLASAWIISYKYSALFAVMFAIFVPIIGSDMFAYFVGSKVGGKKLCPTISPKKTVSGAIGGLIGAMVVAMIFWVIFEYVGWLETPFGGSVLSTEFVRNCGYAPFIPYSDGGWMWKSILIYLSVGLICGVVSELGDLSASAIKRALGIKDYGRIFPGHGGFMDRIDSVMYCLVILLIAFTCIYGH